MTDYEKIEAAKAALGKASPGPMDTTILSEKEQQEWEDLADMIRDAAPALVRRVQELEDWQAKALEALKDSASNKNRIASILRGEDWTCGQPCIGTCKNFKLIENASWKATTLIEQAEGGK